ncbi:MAG: hypothetical protein ACI9GM_000024 [Salibacteraceae bacterium]|jgi:hypothetical protein
MKTKIVLFSCFLFGSALCAQPPHQREVGHGEAKEKRARIEAIKVEYFTTKLSLTPAEAQQFWPVYNECMDKIHALEKKRRNLLKKSELSDLNDSEITTLIEDDFTLEQNILDLKIAYNKKFKEVLPIKKVGKLYQAEYSFRGELLKKMKGGERPPR